MKKTDRSPAWFTRLGCIIALLFIPLFSIAQDTSQPIDDLFESHNKIYVVVLVLSTIFVGIIITLIYLERRIKKLEKSHQ